MAECGERYATTNEAEAEAERRLNTDPRIHKTSDGHFLSIAERSRHVSNSEDIRPDSTKFQK